MAADKRTCPQCGEAVYPTDDVCMSCGADLRAKAAPAPPPPAPPPGVPPPAAAPPPGMPVPGPVARPAPTVSFSESVATRCGRFWDLFPWIGLLAYVLLGAAQFAHLPGFLIAIAAIIYLIWFPLYIFWLVCDVIAHGSGWWWIAINFLCYPFGLVVYLMTER
jgi:hypothetical protein